MFAAVPTWERNKKTRGGSARSGGADPTTNVRRGGMAPMAIAAGLIVVAGVAAAGWYATQGPGVAQLSPGGAATDVVAVVPPTNPQLAQASVPPLASTPAPTPTAERPAAVHSGSATAAHRATTRTRPASRSVEDSGVNASAVAPAPAPAPVQAAPVNPAPTEAAPTPAPTPVAPPAADAPATPQ